MFKRMVLIVALLGWLAAPSLRASEALAVQGAAKVEAAKTEAKTETAKAGTMAHGEAEGEHGKEYPLLPDPTNKGDWLQAIWVVVIFVALLLILIPTAFKNVLAGLKKREQRIRADIAEAEASRKKAEATLKEYNAQLATAEAKIRDMMSKASVDAEKIATNLKMQAQQDVEEIKERSTKEIEAARKAAVLDIYAQAAELSTSIASRILKRNLNPDDQKNLVAQSLEQLQSAGKA